MISGQRLEPRLPAAHRCRNFESAITAEAMGALQKQANQGRVNCLSVDVGTDNRVQVIPQGLAPRSRIIGKNRESRSFG